MSTFDCITKRDLRTRAGERWFARGETYHQQARVTDLITKHDEISASVVGTDTYRVRLSCRNNRFTYSCTCPLGEDGNFCKHCVAVGLTWLDQSSDKPSSNSSLQSFLENMDHQQLVELVISEASRNRRLRDNSNSNKPPLHGQAMMLIWEQFVERPGLDMYKHLHENALQANTPREKLRLVGENEEPNRGDSIPKINKEWEQWRTEALRFLRERIEPSHLPEKRQAVPISNRWNSRRDRSVLVEVFLWECNYEEAWEEATAGGCSAHLRLQLADCIAQHQPAKAYLVYKELIGPTVNGTNNAAYGEAIKLLKKMHKLTARLNCESDFSDHLSFLRAEYKRNFIQMLDKMRQ